MQKGLAGRRIALYAPADDECSRAVGEALAGRGATVDRLGPDTTAEGWHGARYAALVLIGAEGSGFSSDDRVVQLAREFLLSEKPVAAFGSAVNVVVQAGGAAGRKVASSSDLSDEIQAAGGTHSGESLVSDGPLITALASHKPGDFADRVAESMGTTLEEREVDEMSDMSFPASDPPATNPGSIGHLERKDEPSARA